MKLVVTTPTGKVGASVELSSLSADNCSLARGGSDDRLAQAAILSHRCSFAIS